MSRGRIAPDDAVAFARLRAQTPAGLAGRGLSGILAVLVERLDAAARRETTVASMCAARCDPDDIRAYLLTGELPS